MVDPIVPPPSDPRLGPIMPVLARRGHFVPEVDGRLTVMLPGESVMTKVTEVHSRDVVIVEITSTVLGKAGMHTYRTGDVIACQRVANLGGLSETWEPISRREVEMREQADRLARDAVEATRIEMPSEEVIVEPAKRTRRKKKVA